MKLKIAYFGTPDFSARFLENILQDKNLPVEVKLVVTQPDKPVGKKQIVTGSPVKIMAKKYGIKTDCNEHWREGKSGQNLLHSIDLVLLFAYGQIIPAKILQIPRLGFWNVHLSLLPKYRGASPVAYSLIMDDKKTGVTIIKMDKLLDHGQILAQEQTNILPHEKRPKLTIKLTNLAFHLFKKFILTDFNHLQLIQQDHNKVTYTRLLTKQDGFIPFSTLKKTTNNEPLTFEDCPKLFKEYVSKNNATMKQCNNETIYNYFRGLYPWPGIWTKTNINGKEKRLKIIDVDFQVENKLTIKKVQLEGKKEVDFQTFNKAYRVF